MFGRIVGGSREANFVKGNLFHWHIAQKKRREIHYENNFLL